MASLIVPAHLVIGVLALVGIGSVATIRITQSLLATRRLPVVALVWRRTFAATGIAVVATVAWGLLTAHGIGTSGSSRRVMPFNASWRDAVAITTVGSGAVLAIAVAWFMVRKHASIEANLYFGTAVLLVTAALVWGALLGDFTTFHLFFGGIAVFATPVAAVAVWRVWLRARATGRRRLAIAVLVMSVAQIEVGIGSGVGRLVTFGPGGLLPVPVQILDAIKGLPANAKVAYACQPFEEAAFWDARLLGIGAHTGRRMVPMCFEAETFAAMNGAVLSPDIPSPLFRWAPQRELYPDSDAHPSPARVATFLKANGIDYIYADALHPNTLVPDAVTLATDGVTQVLRLP